MKDDERNLKTKLNFARKVYDFAKISSLADLINGKEISYEDLNSKNHPFISNDAIATYSFRTNERGKSEEIILGRTYFSDDINGYQTFLFRLEEFPPILKESVRKFVRSENPPMISLESSSYKSPKKTNTVHPSRRSPKNLSEDLIFKSHHHMGQQKGLGKI